MSVKLQVSKRNVYWIKWSKIAICSSLLGFVAAIFALLFKELVENYEHLLLKRAFDSKWLFFILPLIGLLVIYYLRLYVFKNRKNKGISEVLEAIEFKKKLPSFKIPSHFFNGFLTVVFGGTTGIEVSTVVSTATMGELASKKDPIFKKYKKEFMGAAIAAGVTILFCSPLAGFFFSYETIKKQHSKVFIVTHFFSILIAVGLLFLVELETPFRPLVPILSYRIEALPYFLGLALIASFYGVYMTRMVKWIKSSLPMRNKPLLQLLIGAFLLGITLFFLPMLYGDGYHAIQKLTAIPNWNEIPFSILMIVLALIIKPLITGLTLGLGGDGGVFAPSIYSGAFLGLLIGVVVKTYLDNDIMLMNFVVIGVAVTVSAVLHAPLTALFLTCGLFDSYELFFPLLVLTLLSKMIAKYIFPYTVYSLKLSN